MPDWDNQKALTIFEQMLQKTGNKIDGVLAANDGLGNAAISALKARKLPQIPVTGQDATLAGHPEHRHRRPVHDRLQGDQEGGRRGRQAGHRAAEGRDAERPTRPRSTTARRRSRRCSLTPVAVTKDNIKQYVGEIDFPKKDEICAGKVGG